MRDARKAHGPVSIDVPWRNDWQPRSKAWRDETGYSARLARRNATETLLETLQTIVAERRAGWKPQPIEPQRESKPGVSRPDGARPRLRQRAERGVYMPDSDDDLLASAQASAERWQARLDKARENIEHHAATLAAHVLACDTCEIPGSGSMAFAKLCGPARIIAVHARDAMMTSNKLPARRRRASSRGGEIDEYERLHFAPPDHRLDPPVRQVEDGPVNKAGLVTVICLSCGERHHRKLDSEKPCFFCGGKFLPPQRTIDVYLGEDYSLPVGWYGDDWGVSRHYLAVENAQNDVAKRNGGRYAAGFARRGQPRRIVPTGPAGTLRWMTAKTVSLAKTRSGRPKKPKVVALIPEGTDTSALFYADAGGATSMQTIPGVK